jgi:hypothetical protein
MADFGFASDGPGGRWFWNLAPPNRLRRSPLRLGRCISLAWAAICSLAHCSSQGSASCYIAHCLKMATPSSVNRVPPGRCGLRSRHLFVALVARAVASWPGFRPLWPACAGSSYDQGNSISPKSAGLNSLPTSETEPGAYTIPKARCPRTRRSQLQATTTLALCRIV